MKRIIVFDVNETLLDLSALEAHFERVFGDKMVLREWFNELILFSQALTLTGDYSDFGQVARATLKMMGEERGVELSDDSAQDIIGGIGTLPAHPEVPKSLEKLKKAGFRMVTLTNSPPAIVDAQLRHAGLSEYFERSFSIETVRRFKPAPEPYRLVADGTGVSTSQLLMVAAHAWDVGGAMRAGCSAAFVARPGKAIFPLFPRPGIIGGDLAQVTDAILKAEL